ncbi:MoxR family ATPase [Paenibacillus sp.]|uniref:AAA family ATPase n=1 Tax=Paenibacillus sp. TaxID=58172 RepID=UPI002D57A971|nr:MoxR family ATPase [Paenibacillus sp.]HZG57777.1 MoxR family ATPase [Paenibacillus sp.]
MRLSGQGKLWDRPQALLDGVARQIERVVIGKRDAIEHLLVALLSGGHVLLEDVPGVGKTLLAKTAAGALGCSFRRIQFTPDVLPSDVTGVSIYRKSTESFEFRPGPIFANVVLADELNRTSPKTQSALLEAMEERRVTVDGETYELPRPFMVVATQNPLGFEGAYPLPEAQLDRFLLRVRLGYPTRDEEAALLSRPTVEASAPQPLLLAEEVRELQREAAAVHVDEPVKQYIVALVQATRTRPELALGASPRASLALYRASQALALLRGRSYVIPDDCRELAVPALAHRLSVRAEASFAGHTAESVVSQLVAATPVPSAPNPSRIGGAV